MGANDTQGNEDEPTIGYSNAKIKKKAKLIPWIWEGAIVEGAVTLLSAPEKTGKTTLLSLLLDRRRAGGQLLGRTVYPGKTVLCSEEDDRLWTLRQPPLDFGPNLIFHRPRFGAPSRGRWGRFTGDMCDITLEDCDLLVIDTAASFIPLSERNRRLRDWAIAEIRLVTGIPRAVLILNQSRNMHRPLAAFADIIIEMTVPRVTAPTRRRNFTCVGRYPDTLENTSAELNREGTDYVLAKDCTPARPPFLAILQTLLAETPLTRQEIFDRWPGSRPRQDWLWPTLVRGVQLFIFTVSGKGEAARFGCRDCLAKPAEVKLTALSDEGSDMPLGTSGPGTELPSGP
jgi:hypothetical protein